MLNEHLSLKLLTKSQSLWEGKIGSFLESSFTSEGKIENKDNISWKAELLVINKETRLCLIQIIQVLKNASRWYVHAGGCLE